MVYSSGAAASADKEPRTERGRKTLRRLREAAASEFGERGFHEAAITGITQRAGVALGTFYTYFESKEEVFRALVRDMSRATRAHVAEAVKGAPDRLAAERLGLEPGELTVFEDTDVGVASAKAAGAYVVGLTRTLGAERMAAADELAERIDVTLLERLCS